ncbi:MAG: ABC transporter permease, partial [Pseudomonadota bacterium]|nr:ABC transporter permease [Pseudomonadota bacterium]
MRQIYVPLLAMIIFLLFWEARVWVNDWPNYKMASPSDLGPAFWRVKGLFL